MKSGPECDDKTSAEKRAVPVFRAIAGAHLFATKDGIVGLAANLYEMVTCSLPSIDFPSTQFLATQNLRAVRRRTRENIGSLHVQHSSD